MKEYPVGKSAEGNEAYPPLLLLKCLLLARWFHIDSDPELETQINDRLSFKKFLGLSFDQPSPDYSTFSRFRSRLSHDSMRLVNNELLSQFAARGLTMNEGIAIDALLIQSASRPLSEEKLNHAFRARFTKLIKNAIDALFRQLAFNLLIVPNHIRRLILQPRYTYGVEKNGCKSNHERNQRLFKALLSKSKWSQQKK